MNWLISTLPTLPPRPEFHKPWMQTRGQRIIFKAIYILDDQEVGQFSDEVPVTCQP